jgi:hypothetical protein
MNPSCGRVQRAHACVLVRLSVVLWLVFSSRALLRSCFPCRYSTPGPKQDRRTIAKRRAAQQTFMASATDCVRTRSRKAGCRPRPIRMWAFGPSHMLIRASQTCIASGVTLLTYLRNAGRPGLKPNVFPTHTRLKPGASTVRRFAAAEHNHSKVCVYLAINCHPV